jgi:hypothetical protein
MKVRWRAIHLRTPANARRFRVNSRRHAADAHEPRPFAVSMGLAVLRTSRTDYEKSLLTFFWRASIVSMYGIGP